MNMFSNRFVQWHTVKQLLTCPLYIFLANSCAVILELLNAFILHNHILQMVLLKME